MPTCSNLASVRIPASTPRRRNDEVATGLVSAEPPDARQWRNCRCVDHCGSTARRSEQARPSCTLRIRPDSITTRRSPSETISGRRWGSTRQDSFAEQVGAGAAIDLPLTPQLPTRKYGSFIRQIAFCSSPQGRLARSPQHLRYRHTRRHSEWDPDVWVPFAVPGTTGGSAAT